MNETTRTKKAVENSSDIVSEAIGAVRDNYEDFKEEIQDQGEKLLKTAKAKGNEAWGDIQDRGEGAVKDLKTWVKRNPLPALGWSFAAGAVLYAFFSRDSD